MEIIKALYNGMPYQRVIDPCIRNRPFVSRVMDPYIRTRQFVYTEKNPCKKGPQRVDRGGK